MLISVATAQLGKAIDQTTRFSVDHNRVELEKLASISLASLLNAPSIAGMLSPQTIWLAAVS